MFHPSSAVVALRSKSIKSRGFNGGQVQDDGIQPDNGSPLPASIAPGSQVHPHNGKEYAYDWQDEMRRHKRIDPDIAAVLKQLEAEIEEKMKVAVKLWKARHPTDTLDADLDELLKFLQHRFSVGDQLVEGDLICLHELGDLNRRRHKLISRLRRPSDKVESPVCFPRQVSSDGFNKPNGHRFHVVIIGINEYDDPETPSLKGCVNDAKLIFEYCIKDLLVPNDQIMLLLSPTSDELVPISYNAPTRDNILNALYGLHDNPNIKHDDSIIIFYAGHGQRYHAAKADFECTPRNTGCIEAISPVDRNTPKSNPGEMVVDISDREINVILGEIAKKCANITLILDCCHAGGGTRSSASNSLQLGDKKNLTPRHCPPIPSAIQLMFKAADEEGRLAPDRPRTANPNFRANMESHVLIAAAKDYQEALEYTDSLNGVTQGYFTHRLLSVLRSPLGRDPSTTYMDLIRSPGLGMPFQTAFVAGRKAAKLWFL